MNQIKIFRRCKFCGKGEEISLNCKGWMLEFCSEKCCRANYKKTSLGFVPIGMPFQMPKDYSKKIISLHEKGVFAK